MEWQPTTVLLLGEFHRQRSLAGYSPWGHKESDMTEQLTLSVYTSYKTLIIPPKMSGWLRGKKSTCQCRRHAFTPWVKNIPLEKVMEAHSSILVWEIPWTEEPGWLQSMRSQRSDLTEHALTLHVWSSTLVSNVLLFPEWKANMLTSHWINRGRYSQSKPGPGNW